MAPHRDPRKGQKVGAVSVFPDWTVYKGLHLSSFGADVPLPSAVGQSHLPSWPGLSALSCYAVGRGHPPNEGRRFSAISRQVTGFSPCEGFRSWREGRVSCAGSSEGPAGLPEGRDRGHPGWLLAASRGCHSCRVPGQSAQCQGWAVRMPPSAMGSSGRAGHVCTGGRDADRPPPQGL